MKEGRYLEYFGFAVPLKGIYIETVWLKIQKIPFSCKVREITFNLIRFVFLFFIKGKKKYFK
jgi:hypothetical protein